MHLKIIDRKCHGERSAAISIRHWNVHIVSLTGNSGTHLIGKPFLYFFYMASLIIIKTT